MATSWIQTLENRKLEPLEIKAEQVGSIKEIAHALAHKFRFSGHTEKPYSVAEHCVRGTNLLPPAFAGAFLLHELSEVYLPDIPAPVKPHLEVLVSGGTISWENLEREHTHVMLQALGLASLEPLIYSPEVKRMDLAMLAAEKRDLVGPEPEPWGLTVEPDPRCARIFPVSPDEAMTLFLRTFINLFERGNKNAINETSAAR